MFHHSSFNPASYFLWPYGMLRSVALSREVMMTVVVKGGEFDGSMISCRVV